MNETAGEGARSIGIVACGALARDLTVLKKQNQCQHWHLYCLPPELHNRPSAIAPRVAAKLAEVRHLHDELFVAYADCGTGGAVDKVIGEFGASRLPGAHCYETFAGDALLNELMAEEPGTFLLTDFLVRHFDRLVIVALSLDKHPELCSAYFGNYTRVVHLAQQRDSKLQNQARRCARALRLRYNYRFTGRSRLLTSIAREERFAPW